jgi:hypothetical protein
VKEKVETENKRKAKKRKIDRKKERRIFWLSNLQVSAKIYFHLILLIFILYFFCWVNTILTKTRIILFALYEIKMFIHRIFIIHSRTTYFYRRKMRIKFLSKSLIIFF